ncbi:MAG: DUF4249 family protein [Bacteroidetes bacterium]|nr:DUF4249 family protein [Bacteroidota bacterium]
MRIFLYIFCSVFCLACDKTADIQLPKSNPKIALTGFLSPGLPIQITLIKVQPLFGGSTINKPLFIGDGIVYISNGNDTSQLNLSASGEFYEEAIPNIEILPGKTYYVWASAAGLPPVSASCTVPDSSVRSFSMSHYASKTDSDTTFYISMVWKDIQGQSNFYRIYSNRQDSTASNLTSHSYQYSTSYYNDFGRDGEEIQTSLGQVSGGGSNTRHRYILAGLITCDENYFRYHLGLETLNAGDPFAQPSSLYSNVQGGVGCFGAYLQYTDIFKVF